MNKSVSEKVGGGITVHHPCFFMLRNNNNNDTPFSPDLKKLSSRPRTKNINDDYSPKSATLARTPKLSRASSVNNLDIDSKQANCVGQVAQTVVRTRFGRRELITRKTMAGQRFSFAIAFI